MRRVEILREPAEAGGISYRAIAGTQQSVGKTAGEALDVLTALLPPDDGGTVAVIQNGYPDRFFSAEQKRRLKTLMDRWRALRDGGAPLPPGEQAELEALVEAELEAAAQRAAAMRDELAR
jgi:hypothetical protein